MKYSLTLFCLKRSLVFPILWFSSIYFLGHWGSLSYHSLLFFGTLTVSMLTVLWWLTRPSRTNTKKKKKDVLFIVEDWNAKVRNQEIPGVTGKFSLGVDNEAGERLTEFCQENTMVIARDDFILGLHQVVNTKSDWLYSLQPKMEKLYTVSKNKTGSWLWLRSWTPYCKIQT